MIKNTIWIKFLFIIKGIIQKSKNIQYLSTYPSLAFTIILKFSKNIQKVRILKKNTKKYIIHKKCLFKMAFNGYKGF